MPLKSLSLSKNANENLSASSSSEDLISQNAMKASAESKIRINCTNESEHVTRKKKIKIFLRSFISILIYYFFSITLTFYNRHLFATYQYPLSITLVHLIVKLFLSWMIRLILVNYYKSKRIFLDWHTYVTRLLPTSLASATDIGLSNWSLQYITVSLYTMSKSTVILFIFFFAILFKLEKWRRSIIAVVLCISIGLLLFTYDSTQFHPFGFTLVMIASFTAGLRWTLAQLVTQKHELGLSNPIDMIYHVQPGMIVFLIPLAFYVEAWPTYISGKQMELFHNLMDNFVWVILGSFLAFFLESSEYLVVSYTSSLTLSISGIFKEICTLYLAVVWTHNQLNTMNAVGLFLCLIGICFHIYFKAQAQDESSGDDLRSKMIIRRANRTTVDDKDTKKRTFNFNKFKSNKKSPENISLDSHKQPLLNENN